MEADKETLPPPTLAQYPELILGAIETLGDENGASTFAISKHIESVYGELPAAHSTLLSHHLNKMMQTGELVMYKGNYLKPDPTRPLPRGRGRPPKAKISEGGDVASPPRKRGRPAKVGGSGGEAKSSASRPRGRPRTIVDGEAKSSGSRPRGRPAKVVDPIPSSRAKRPRGRPFKNVTVKASSVLSRGRGRPPNNVIAKAPSKSPRPRGRPPNNVNAEAPSLSPRGRGRPPKNVNAEANSISSRPRGRPPKKDEEIEGPFALPVSNSRGRKPGRPKKIVKSGDEMIKESALPLSGTKRGRGRPPKAKPV